MFACVLVCVMHLYDVCVYMWIFYSRPSDVEVVRISSQKQLTPWLFLCGGHISPYILTLLRGTLSRVKE